MEISEIRRTVTWWAVNDGDDRQTSRDAQTPVAASNPRFLAPAKDELVLVCSVGLLLSPSHSSTRTIGRNHLSSPADTKPAPPQPTRANTSLLYCTNTRQATLINHDSACALSSERTRDSRDSLLGPGDTDSAALRHLSRSHAIPWRMHQLYRSPAPRTPSRCPRAQQRRNQSLSNHSNSKDVLDSLLAFSVSHHRHLWQRLEEQGREHTVAQAVVPCRAYLSTRRVRAMEHLLARL